MRYRVKTYSQEPNGYVTLQTFGVDAESFEKAIGLAIRSVELQRVWPDGTVHRAIQYIFTDSRG